MIGIVRRAWRRRGAVRIEAAELVRLHGLEAAEMALDRAFREGAPEDERRFWRDVARFASWWHEHLRSLDTATRYEALSRYSR